MHQYILNLLCHVANVLLARASDMAKSTVIVGGDWLPNGMKTKKGIVVAILQTTYRNLENVEETEFH